MAGAGSRFVKQGFTKPKPLLTVQGQTLIEHSIRSFNVDAQFVFVTRKFDDPAHNAELSALLKTLRPESVEIQLTQLSQGASDTVLAAKEHINTDDSLVVYNCDQLIRWDPSQFLDFVNREDPGGALVLYNSTSPKNSFAEITDGRVTRVVEKNPISHHALIGFHYWKHGKDFVRSAEKLRDQFRVSGQPECYVSETYNFLINEGFVVLPYHVATNVYVPLGTPEDVAAYEGQQKEFYSIKPKTIFCDIDGTILRHFHKISTVLESPAELLEGVKKKFDQWDSQGYYIVLTSARKESTRAYTEAQLNRLGIAWDQLIMGVTSGTRVLINDRLQQSDPNRAQCVNLVTDQSWTDVDWESTGL